MTKFSELAAASHGAGFQYYDVQDFSFTKPGVFLPTSGSGGTFYHHNTSTFTLDKNRFNEDITNQVMTSILMSINVDGLDLDTGSDKFHLISGAMSDSVVVGSSGGFPIFYGYNISVSSDANNLIFTIDVGNPSGVNNVTSDAITIAGKVFFYLAPF